MVMEVTSLYPSSIVAVLLTQDYFAASYSSHLTFISATRCQFILAPQRHVIVKTCSSPSECSCTDFKIKLGETKLFQKHRKTLLQSTMSWVNAVLNYYHSILKSVR